MNSAVFDTNVLLSAAIFRSGPPFKCLDLAQQGAVASITCREILDEFREKLVEKFNRTPEQADVLVDEVQGLSRLVAITGSLKAVEADPDDDKVVECAVTGQATHIITGDARHLLRLGEYKGIHIISPAQFVALVTDDD